MTSIDNWWCELFSSTDAKDADRFVEFLTDEAELRFGSSPAVRGTAAIKKAISRFFNYDR